MRYEEEAIRNPNILDEVFSEMHKARKIPMNDKQTKYSLSIMLANDEQLDSIYNSLSKTFPIGGFMLRCGIFPIKYEKRVLLWLSLIMTDFGIGGMILIGYYVQWWAFHNKEKLKLVQGELSFDTIVERLFPFGVFSEETVHEFWDKQKVKARPDNLIDHRGASLSFMPEPESSLSS